MCCPDGVVRMCCPDVLSGCVVRMVLSECVVRLAISDWRSPNGDLRMVISEWCQKIVLNSNAVNALGEAFSTFLVCPKFELISVKPSDALEFTRLAADYY